jgi:small subunit ribosomal protein S9
MLLQEYSYGTGRRKDAVARVWVKSGTGVFTINGFEPLAYLDRDRLVQEIVQPLEAMGGADQFDVRALVTGGGKTGQAGAIRHGIAKAFVNADESNRGTLGPLGLMTRDPRVKERKHAGKRGARRAKQFSKR